ncbi:MAG TPA: hypothetical protein VNZ86_14935 [Bacteroidia bacterium]|jgi:hypothetical protein|nr:hypothetical protein [Bacteroidia bacterium]
MHRLRFLLCLFLPLTGIAQISNSTELLDAMLKKYTGKWCKTATFIQYTYRPNDSLNKHMTWYEAVEYPDRLRIDFNSITKGNAALFRNDSAYRYRNGVLQDTRKDKHDMLLIMGGLYFRKKEDVVSRLAALNYNLDHFSENRFQNRPVYVLGAEQGDSVNNQIWVDKADLRVVRAISQLSGSDVLDMRVESSTRACGGFIESKLSFYINGKLDQYEEYVDVHTGIKIDPGVFDPTQFGKVHWRVTKEH